VAPGSDRCWAVQSSDSAPVLIALGARARLASPRGVRELPLEALYGPDGIQYLAKAPDEILTDLIVPPPGSVRSHYGKLRRRGSFDFPVLGVATAVGFDGDVVRDARIVLGAVESRPLRASAAEAFLVGKRLTDDVVRAAADLAFKPAKPLDNTDFENAWRKKMVKVFVRDGLRSATLTRSVRHFVRGSRSTSPAWGTGRSNRVSDTFGYFRSGAARPPRGGRPGDGRQPLTDSVRHFLSAVGRRAAVR
jgi:CO/xanthine dehydrogenase FAD-binding subunit